RCRGGHAELWRTVAVGRSAAARTRAGITRDLAAPSWRPPHVLTARGRFRHPDGWTGRRNDLRRPALSGHSRRSARGAHDHHGGGTVGHGERGAVPAAGPAVRSRGVPHDELRELQPARIARTQGDCSYHGRAGDPLLPAFGRRPARARDHGPVAALFRLCHRLVRPAVRSPRPRRTEPPTCSTKRSSMSARGASRTRLSATSPGSRRRSRRGRAPSWRRRCGVWRCCDITAASPPGPESSATRATTSPGRSATTYSRRRRSIRWAGWTWRRAPWRTPAGRSGGHWSWADRAV